MEEFKGTRGSWERENETECSDTYFIRPTPTFGESEYNAKLIAAAPDLLEALQKIVDDNYDFGDVYEIRPEYRDLAEKAINKALGK